MSYQVYKVAHFISLFLFFTGSSVLLLTDRKTVFWKALTGVASLLILVTGMGLVARLRTGMAPWVQGLMVIWFLLTGFGHMVAKRFPHFGFKAYWITMAMAFFAVFLAVYKPA